MEVKYSGFPVRVFGEADGTDLQEVLSSRVDPKMVDGPAGLIPADRPSYLLRVDFGPKATVKDVTGGIVSFFEFSRIPNLGLMSQIYLCEDKKCTGVLTSECRVGLNWVCPVCGKSWRQEEDIGSGMFYFQQYLADWGDTIARYFERLRGMSEVLLMRRRVSITALTDRVLRNEPGAVDAYVNSFALDPKNSIEASYYTLQKIHSDISTASSPGKAFETFLRGG